MIDARLCKERTHVLALLLAGLNLLFMFQDFGCPLLSEYLLDSRHDVRNLNDLLHEHVDIVEQVIVRWIMDDCPIRVILCLQNRVDLEDWDQFLPLRVADNSLVKVQKSDLDRVLQGLQ